MNLASHISMATVALCVTFGLEPNLPNPLHGISLVQDTLEVPEELLSASDDEIARWVQVLLAGGYDKEVMQTALSLWNLDAESSARFVTDHAATFERAARAYAKERRAVSKRILRSLGEAAKVRAREWKENGEAVERSLVQHREDVLVLAREGDPSEEEWRTWSKDHVNALRSKIVVRRSVFSESDGTLMQDHVKLIRDKAPLQVFDQAFIQARSHIAQGPGGEEALESLRFPKTLDDVAGEYDWAERIEGLALGADSRSMGSKVRKCLKPLMKLDGPRRVLYWELIELRVLMDLDLLTWDPKLAEAAALHAEDMVRLGFFDHESPVPGRLTFGDRAQECGTRAHGECIAKMGDGDGEDQPSRPFELWWGQPADAVKLLGDWRRCGAARFEDHWVLVFQK